jgi:hypothetical protein
MVPRCAGWSAKSQISGSDTRLMDESDYPFEISITSPDFVVETTRIVTPS